MLTSCHLVHSVLARISVFVLIVSVMPAAHSKAASTCPDVPDGVHLASDYKGRKCRWCHSWSFSLCPWPLTGTVLAAWDPLLPWARGTKEKPIGSCCKVCIVVSWMNFK